MKIKKGRITVEDIMDKLVDSEQGITCGCDNPSLKMTMHLDCTDYYQSNYICECGNQICVVVERDEESMDLWR